jgi:hypothetical protein
MALVGHYRLLIQQWSDVMSTSEVKTDCGVGKRSELVQKLTFLKRGVDGWFQLFFSYFIL